MLLARTEAHDVAILVQALAGASPWKRYTTMARRPTCACECIGCHYYNESCQGLSGIWQQSRENPTGVFRIFHTSQEKVEVCNSFIDSESS